MKKITTLALFICISSCIYAQKPKQQPIVGTWQLIDFADFDSTTNVWVYRYGENPKGYFTYTASGVLSINICNEHPLKISEEESKKRSMNVYDYINTNSFGYFGTYTFEPEKGRVIHRVKGGTIP